MEYNARHDVAAILRLAAVPRILEACARSTGMRFTAVARVTDQHWIACAVHDELAFGVRPGGELPLETTICNEIRQHGQPVIFSRASDHPQYASHHTPRIYGLESYISVPILRADGSFFGTLCAIDPAPAPALDDPNVRRTFELFAELISLQLEADEEWQRSDAVQHDTREQLHRSQSDLMEAHDVARLREQFIAVLGHDLRGPLHAVSTGADTLQLLALSAPALRIVENMRRASSRMDEMVGNLLDLARGRLGSGIPVEPVADAPVGALIEQVIAEVRAAHPGRIILPSLHLHAPVHCDPPRIAQAFANLLANAAQHGADDQPIRVDAKSGPHGLRITVHNGGPPIPAVRRASLFKPFSRGGNDDPRGGLGLGLYIAAEIARAHGGELRLDEGAGDGTRFVLTLPARPTPPTAAP